MIILFGIILAVLFAGIGIAMTLYLRGTCKLHISLNTEPFVVFCALIFFSISAPKSRTRTGLINARVEEIAMNRM